MLYNCHSLVSNYTAKVCGEPLDGTNTVSVPADLNMVFGDEYTYSCLNGYEPETPGMDMVTTCMANGALSLDPLPVCVCK